MAHLVQQAFVLVSIFLVCGTTGKSLGVPPDHLFKAYFAGLPGVLQSGYPNKGLMPLDPWNTNAIAVYWSLNETDFLDFHLVSTLVGFSDFSVTDFKLDSDNVTKDLLVSASPSTGKFDFKSTYACKGYVAGSFINFTGTIDLGGSSYERNITYLVYLDKRTYKFRGFGVEGNTVDMQGKLSIDQTLPNTISDIIKQHENEIIQDTFLSMEFGYSTGEADIGAELLLRLQMQ